MKYLTALQ